MYTLCICCQLMAEVSTSELHVQVRIEDKVQFSHLRSALAAVHVHVVIAYIQYKFMYVKFCMAYLVFKQQLFMYHSKSTISCLLPCYKRYECL